MPAPSKATQRRDRRRSLHTRLQVECLEDRTLLSATAFVPNEVLVKFIDGVAEADKASVLTLVQAAQVEQSQAVAMSSAGEGNLEVLRGPVDVLATVAMLNSNPLVAYAEPNWVLTYQAVSNDPKYTDGSLWGMYSNDSPSVVGPTGTTNQYGSQAEEAWSAGFTGSSTVYVGIIDEGIYFDHPDLADNIWVNPYDTADGIDNDGNGYIDDIRGWDFYENNNTIYDGSPTDLTTDAHGTHVAGTIGAVGENEIGVAGVNWNVQMISGKFLGPDGGYITDAIKAVDYFIDLKTRHGLNIVALNNSWGGGGYSQAMQEAIARAGNAGILFVAASGNGNFFGVGINNDTSPQYPASYTNANVIAVAAIDNVGAKAQWSNYGATSVDLGAPGVGIWSTTPQDAYSSYSGTSMATPHVTGAAALYASNNTGATAAQIKAAILSSTTATTSLSGKTVTGGRLNVSALMTTPLPTIPTIPDLSINDVAKVEGNSGTTTFTFTVTLTSSSTNTVTVKYATANGTATAGSKQDYTAKSGTLTFTPGVTSQTISVSVRGETKGEQHETFFVNLSNPTNANLPDSQGVGTIVNDDAGGASQVSALGVGGAASWSAFGAVRNSGIGNSSRGQAELNSYVAAVSILADRGHANADSGTLCRGWIQSTAAAGFFSGTGSTPTVDTWALSPSSAAANELGERAGNPTTVPAYQPHALDAYFAQPDRFDASETALPLQAEQEEAAPSSSALMLGLALALACQWQAAPERERRLQAAG